MDEENSFYLYDGIYAVHTTLCIYMYKKNELNINMYTSEPVYDHIPAYMMEDWTYARGIRSVVSRTIVNIFCIFVLLMKQFFLLPAFIFFIEST